MDRSGVGSFVFDPFAQSGLVSMDDMKVLIESMGFFEGGDGHGTRLPKDSFNRKLLVAAHEAGRSVEMHLQMKVKLTAGDSVIVSCTADEQSKSRPKPTPLSGLKEIFLPQLEVGKRHYGRALFGTFCVQPFKVASVNTVLADRSGKGVRVIIYNVGNSLSTKEIEDMFPSGRRVAIKEPYFKLCADLKVAVRVENPADVVLVDDSNREVVVDKKSSNPPKPGVRPEAKLTLEQELDWIRAEGNRLFAEQNWDGAIEQYTRCIERGNSAPEIGENLKQNLLLAYSNRAEAWLQIHKFREALDDANRALSFDSKHQKSLSRRDRAWRGFGKVTIPSKTKSTVSEPARVPELVVPVDNGFKDKDKAKNSKENESPATPSNSKAPRAKHSNGDGSKVQPLDSKKNCTGDISSGKATNLKKSTGDVSKGKTVDSKTPSAGGVSRAKAADSKTSAVDVAQAKATDLKTSTVDAAIVKATDLKTATVDAAKVKAAGSKTPARNDSTSKITALTPREPLGTSKANVTDSRGAAVNGDPSAIQATDSSLQSSTKASKVKPSEVKDKVAATTTTASKGKKKVPVTKVDSSPPIASKAKSSDSKPEQADSSNAVELHNASQPPRAEDSKDDAPMRSSRDDVAVTEDTHKSSNDDIPASIVAKVQAIQRASNTSVQPVYESNGKIVEVQRERPVAVDCEGPHFAQWLENVCASGDKFLGQCKWTSAVRMYEKVIEYPTPKRNRDKVLRTMFAAYSHRSEAWIWLGNFENCLRDAELALDIVAKNPQTGEGMESKQFLNEVRRGRAFHGLGEFGKACLIFTAALARVPSDVNIKDLLDKSRICSVQSREGIYDLDDFFRNGCRGPPPPCSDFVGPVEIRWVLGKGRGLFATADMEPGDLLLVSNPLAVMRRRFRKQLDDEEDDYSQLACKWRTRQNVFGLDEFIERLSSLSQSSQRIMYQLLCLSAGHPDEARAIEMPEMNVFIPGRHFELPANWENLSVNLERIVFMNAIDGRLNPLDGAHLDVGESIGCVGLWALPSFLNHSCVPNCHMIDIGNAMFVRASRRIAQGEELNRAYFDVYQTVVDRRQATEEWSFVCNCERCVLERMLDSQHLLPLEEYKDIVERVREESLKRLESSKKDRSLNLLLPNPQPALMQLRRFAGWFDTLLSQAEGLGNREKAWVGASHLPAYVCRLNGSRDVHEWMLSLEIILDFMTNTAILGMGQADTPLQRASLLLDQVEAKYGKASKTYARIETRVLHLYSTTYGKLKKEVLLAMSKMMTTVKVA